MKQMRSPLALLAVAVLVTAGISGCSGNGSGGSPLQAVSERASPNLNAVIAYAAFGGGGQLFVFSVRDTGSGNRLLTPLDNDANVSNDGGFHPAWSPDGSTIAFVRTDDGNNDIFTMGANGTGGGVTQLTTDTGSDKQPCYSRQADKIAFVSNRDGTNDIWIMDPDGGNQTQVTSGPADDQWPCFDDTGQFIAYQSDADATPDQVDDTDIWVEDLNSPGTPTDLTDGSPSDQGAPSWSPDGTTILYHDDVAGSFDVWSMDSNGANPQQLVVNPLSQGFPVWYPDGSRFAYVEARAIWTALPDGTDPFQVTRSVVQP
ncbi:MAG: DPP IV N-terminal domain-containing protein [Armatimonadota bacterium]|jgi:Tol biopolymer transport system component